MQAAGAKYPLLSNLVHCINAASLFGASHRSEASTYYINVLRVTILRFILEISVSSIRHGRTSQGPLGGSLPWWPCSSPWHTYIKEHCWCLLTLTVIIRRVRQAQLFLLIFCCEPMCLVPCGPFSWDLPYHRQQKSISRNSFLRS